MKQEQLRLFFLSFFDCMTWLCLFLLKLDHSSCLSISYGILFYKKTNFFRNCNMQRVNIQKNCLPPSEESRCEPKESSFPKIVNILHKQVHKKMHLWKQ